MASPTNPFRRLIELVLDKPSAQKAQRDTQAALGRATDPKGATANLNRVGSALNSVTRLFLQAGAAVAGYALGLTRLTERGGQVLNVQRAFTRAVGDADAALNKLRAATGGLISDYELMVGFNKALSLGAVQTVEQFGEMADVARELGKALGVDASYAMEQLSLGIARHSIKILDNIGITAKATDDFATIMEKARQRVDEFGKSSTNAADLLQRVLVQFGNLKDEIGKFLAQSDTLRVAFFEVGNVLETLVLALQSGNVETAKDAFKHVGLILGETFAAAFFDGVQKILDSPTGRAMMPLLGAIFGIVEVAPLIPVLGPFAAPLGGLGGALGGLGIGRVGSNLAGKAAAAGREAADAEVEALAALGREIEARQAARAKASGIVTTQARTEGPASAPGIGRNANAEARFEEIRNFGRSLFGTPSNPEFAQPADGRVTDQFDDLVDHFRTGFGEIESAGQTAALGLEDAFARAFQLIGDEGVSAGDILEEVFRGTAAAGLTALAQYATGKVTEDVANAFDQFAKASAAAAEFNPVSAALHMKAAHGFLLGAAKWALVGGAAQAAAGAAGGGSSSFRGSDVTGREIDKLDRAESIVNVYVDGVDPRNPKHQRVLYETVANAQKGAGRNATVNILPRGA